MRKNSVGREYAIATLNNRRDWETDSGLRIDHLQLRLDLAPRLRDAGVDRWVRGEPHASDHAPAWIKLDMGARTRRGS